ncbi:zinc-finger domain-containing protein [Chitiniphilus shinanonensis]|uniref:Zinc-finger domain-containing protein n=1 Tax=Chitiniphilus shinanonensis TaxID=553088 RepID=A0ABQ6BSI1_9NEIS|nr:zinc-finger domain-containing protein [Chitiniphilus shinanonensis]GLS04574.1 zinc-finger domain-containing protein [Chitiniphilus shinanonensis]
MALHENTQREIEVTAKDLPLHCPTPDQVKWNSHPRVFLPIEKTGEALCPYCGTRYRLKAGEVVKGH